MTHWVRFCSTCPIANYPNPKKVFYCHHAGDDYEQEINEDRYVICWKSGCSMNSNPCFILDLSFNWGNHTNKLTYNKKAYKMAIFNALSIVSCGDIGLYPDDKKNNYTKY